MEGGYTTKNSHNNKKKIVKKKEDFFTTTVQKTSFLFFSISPISTLNKNNIIIFISSCCIWKSFFYIEEKLVLTLLVNVVINWSLEASVKQYKFVSLFLFELPQLTAKCIGFFTMNSWFIKANLITKSISLYISNTISKTIRKWHFVTKTIFFNTF